MKGVTYLNIIFFILICIKPISSQTPIWVEDSTLYSPPRPSVGWDSLESLIVYPEVYCRTGVEQSESITIFINANGVIDRINYGKLYELFRQLINSAVYSVKWIPGKYKGTPVDTSIIIPFHFNLYDSENAPPMNITSRKKVTKGHWESLPIFIDTTCVQIPDKRPEDFNFIFKWWFYVDSLCLITSENFLKSRKGDVDTSITFKLSENELDSIYRIMKQIYFLCYPKDYKPSFNGGWMDPAFDFYCKMEVLDFENEVSINTGMLLNDPSYKKLKDFYWMIYSIIHKSSDYKKIRKPTMIYIYE
jgi:hypothetical protein